MDKGWTATVEVAQSLSYLTKNIDFVGKNKVFVGVFLQIASQGWCPFSRGSTWGRENRTSSKRRGTGRYEDGLVWTTSCIPFSKLSTNRLAPPGD